MDGDERTDVDNDGTHEQDTNETTEHGKALKDGIPTAIDFDAPYGGTVSLRFSRATYADDGALAVIATCDGDVDIKEDYAVVTVNLPQSASLPEDCQFADVNNVPTLIERMEEVGLLEMTGDVARSGYVTYPLARFAIDAIPEVPAE